MNRLLLIDTFNYIHRAYHAIPKNFKDQTGGPVNAVYGFTSMLISLIDVLKPTHVIAAYESPGPTFRDDRFAAYKATRKEMEGELKEQLPKIKEVIDSFGIQSVQLPGFEADDIIGSLAYQAKDKGVEVAIVSNDKDLLQLLDSHVKVFIPDKTKEGGSFFGVSEFKQKYGFEPIHIVDYKALRGDSSDNIPGVMGVGEQTATQFVKKYQTVENLYEHIEDIESESMKMKLVRGYETAVLSKKLATIVCDTSIKLNLDECQLRHVDRLKVLELLKKYNFKSLIRRLGFEVEGDSKSKTSKSKADRADKSQLSML